MVETIYCNLCGKKIGKDDAKVYKGQCNIVNESLYWCNKCNQTAILVVFGSNDVDGNHLFLLPVSPDEIKAYSATDPDIPLYYGKFESNGFADGSWNFLPDGKRLFCENDIETIKKMLQFLKKLG